MEKNLGLVQSLLEKGAPIGQMCPDPDNRQRNVSALVLAVQNFQEVAQELPAYGAARTDESRVEAVQMGRFSVVRLLLAHGADVNRVSSAALQCATKKNLKPLVQCLLKHGADAAISPSP